MEKLWRTFKLTPATQVLDVGGAEWNWSFVPAMPDLVVLNLSAPAERQARWLVADGCRLPFADQSFDLVYNNSVIEHLHTFAQQQAFAAEVRRVGRRYYVQTPNRTFFFEPHFLTPFIHWFSPKLRRRLLPYTVWGLLTHPSPAQCRAIADEIRLLDEAEVRQLFPDGEVWHERVLGWTKSLIAIKNT